MRKILKKKLNSAEIGTQKSTVQSHGSTVVVRGNLVHMDVAKILAAVSTRVILDKETSQCRTRQDGVAWKPLLLQATGLCNSIKP